MAFHKQNFNQRFATMGDPAEQAFDMVYPKHHKLGLNRPPFFMGGMSPGHRYTPDRMLRDREVECMGVGKDGVLKLKMDKLAALLQRLAIGPVSLFVWDSYNCMWYDAPVEDWKRQVVAFATDGKFENDDKTFHALPIAHFPSTPRPIPEAPLANPS